MVRWAVLAVAALTAVGCSTFSSDDDGLATPGAEDGGADGASTDSAVADGASVDGGADSALPAGILLREGFEGGGCGGWSARFGIAMRADGVSRSGTASCKLCLSVTGDVLLSKPTPGVGPGTYTLNAWARKESTAGWSAQLYASGSDGGSDVLGNQGVLLDAPAWTPMQVILSTTGRADEIEMRLGSNDMIGACMYIDDVELRFDK